MPCYRCGTQGYETNSAGYCLNSIKPLTEVRIAFYEDLEYFLELLEEEHPGIRQRLEGDLLPLGGKRICQTCDQYLQDVGTLLPENHASITYWSPPSLSHAYDYDYYDYMEDDPRTEDITDPGCLCEECYPERERETLIDYYRGPIILNCPNCGFSRLG
jgi:hypothetical protein